MPTTETIQEGRAKDAEPSLAQLLKTEAKTTRKQHFDSGGGLQINGGCDSWGSISKMLHRRYNTGAGSAEATGEKFGDNSSSSASVSDGIRFLSHRVLYLLTDDIDTRTNGVKRVGPTNTTAAPSSWKRCKQEETAKQGASNSVLMNLLVSGCDVSAGYVCFTSPKPKNATATAAATTTPPPQRCHHNNPSRFYEQHRHAQPQRQNAVTAK